MSHRRDEYFERLQDHLIEREWSDVQIVNFTQIIGRSALISCQGALQLLEFQQEIDENIQAQKEHDRVFKVIPEQFFEDTYIQGDLEI